MRTGRSEKRQTHVHVHDLGDFYVLFVEQTAAGGGKATWERKAAILCSVANKLLRIDRVLVPTWQVALV